MNLLLVDLTIPQVDTFLNSVNENTKTVTYSITDTFESLKEKIDSLQINNFNNIGFVFVDEYHPLKMFVSYNSFITFNSDGIIENNTTKFIKEIITKYSVKKLDFLACNLLSYSEWKNYFDYLMKDNEGLLVRASNDKTGNLNAGGDWILESTNQDISNLYFNENIQNWNELLDKAGDIFGIIKKDGTLWLTGDNTNGQLGTYAHGSEGFAGPYSSNFVQARIDEPFTNQYGTFHYFNPLTNIIAVSCGYYHTAAIKSDGTLWTCGRNNYTQLGYTTTTNFYPNTNQDNYNFAQVPNVNNVTMVVCEYNATGILKSDGTIWFCGANTSGYFGMGNKTNLTTFTQVPSITDAVMLKMGQDHSAIIRSNNELWTCGQNDSGQLGFNKAASSGGVSEYLVFTKVQNVEAIDVACGAQHTVIIKPNNTVWGCGYGQFGQCGSGDTYNTIDIQLFTQESNGITDAISVSCNWHKTIIIRHNNTNNEKSIWSCGLDYDKEFGLNGTSTQMVWRFTRENTNINNASVIISGAHSTMVIKADGSVFACGLNNKGQLGLGNTTNKNIFTLTGMTSNARTLLPQKVIKSNNITSSGYSNLNLNNVAGIFPNVYTSTLTNTEVPLVNASSTPFASITNLQKIITLQPAGTTFSDYISFNITVNDTSLTVIDFFSSNDTSPVRLGTVSTNSYGAYYEIIDATTVKIYTKHFSGAAASENGGCLLKGTSVLTSDGYKLIETLNNDDIIITDDNRYLPIKRIQKLIINPNKHPDLIPYKINKNSIEENYPSEDTYMSGYHMIKYGNNWVQPNKCPKFKKDKSIKEIVYYHIELENFKTDNLIVNGGLVVESLGNGTISDSEIWGKRSKYSLII